LGIDWIATGARNVHELAITESLVDCVCEQAGDARVLRIVIEIGARSGVVADAVRGCFEVCAKETQLEGASLEVIETSGQELRLREVEVI
jgi:hydrogenase nickel incorporation protein HypA/HybF